jgi:butyryl-CoA dehydrogenase
MEWQKLSKKLALEVIAPGVMERDEHEEFSRALFDTLGRDGLTGISFPEGYGGRGGDCLSYILAAEELAKVDDSLAVSLSASVMLCQWPIYLYGTERQKQQYLRPLVEGNKLGAFALTEEKAGTDASAQQATAIFDGNCYRLNGSKIFITNGGEADIYVVFAMTDKRKGTKGISAFILENGMEGFTFGLKERKLGIRSSPTRALYFKNVRVPVENLLGTEGEGFKIAMGTLDGGRVSVAAQAVGIAEAAFTYALAYAKERVQFDKPISTNQAIAFMLANMATEIKAARMLTYQAAYKKDQKESYTQDAAMAKLYASNMAVNVTTNAIQIFGGYGYRRDYPVERLLRDAKITQIFEGTNEVQQMVIASHILH